MIKTVGVIVFKKNKVLVVKHLEKAGNLAGIYGLPAGRRRKGETEIDCGKREFQEESGLSTETEDLEKLPKEYKAHLIRQGKKMPAKMSVYYCRNYSGVLKNSTETAPEWVLIKKLRSLNLLPNVFYAVKEAFALYG